MKLFEIKSSFVFRQIFNLEKEYGNSVVISPDYVFEGWGFDITQKGENRFIKPECPNGFKYDEKTGTFYKGEIEIHE